MTESIDTAAVIAALGRTDKQTLLSLNTFFRSRTAAHQKLAFLSTTLGNQDVYGADALAWRTRLAAIPQKKQPDACKQIAELLKREQEHRTAQKRQADARDRYTVNSKELQRMNSEEFEVLQALLISRLETVRERFEILRRMHALPRIPYSSWRKWKTVPEESIDEVLAEVTRLVEVERSRRASAQNLDDQTTGTATDID